MDAVEASPPGPVPSPADEESAAAGASPPRAARKSATAFRTISEVADELHVPQHVLRFWEGKFPQLRPLKRGGGRRYYRPEDIALLRRIGDLLYTQGYTIKGVQRVLRDGTAAGGGKSAAGAGGRGAASDAAPPDAPEDAPPEADAAAAALPGEDESRLAVLRACLEELEAIAARLRALSAEGAAAARPQG